MPRSHPALGLVLGLAAVVLFGGSLPATRLAVAALDPWFVTSGRAAIGGVVAVLCFSPSGRAFGATRSAFSP